VNYGHDIEGELGNLEREIERDEELAQACPPRWLALQLLERAPEAALLVSAATPARPSPPRSRPASTSWNPTWAPTAPPWWPSGATASTTGWWAR